MKKYIFPIIGLILLYMGTACSPVEEQEKELYQDHRYIEDMYISWNYIDQDTDSFSCYFIPDDALYTDLVWTSSHPEIFEIDANGIGKYKNPKEINYNPITITATHYAVNESDKTISRNIEIKKSWGEETGLYFLDTNIKLLPSTTYSIRYAGFNSPDSSAIFWESSNPAIATVDSKGKVTAGSQYGSTTIKGTYHAPLNQDIVFSNICIVEVAPFEDIFEMKPIQGGSFIMGKEDEKIGYLGLPSYPLHKVTLSSFQMSAKEITNEQFRMIIGKDSYGSYHGSGKCPITYISYNEAMDFCQKLSQATGKKISLPTEAQWEYAAKGGIHHDSYLYAGSNDINEVAWFEGNSEEIQIVGQKKPNSLGLYDMSGNVYELCIDTPYEYTDQDEYDPIHTDLTNQNPYERIVRGGSYTNPQYSCTTTVRDITSGDGNGQIGFRIILIP